MAQDLLAVIYTTCALNFPADLPNPTNWVETDPGFWWNTAISRGTGNMSVQNNRWTDGDSAARVPNDILLINPELKFNYGVIYRQGDGAPDESTQVCHIIKKLAQQCTGDAIFTTMAGIMKVDELKCESS